VTVVTLRKWHLAVGSGSQAEKVKQKDWEGTDAWRCEIGAPGGDGGRGA